MSLLRHAVRDVLRPIVKTYAGVSVRYKSVVDGLTYPLDGSTLTATLDNTQSAEDVFDEGFVFTNKSKDFKIDVTEFHDAIPHSPQHKDVIIVVDGLGLPDQHFMVLGGAGARAVEPLGNFEDAYRISTKQIPTPQPTTIQAQYGNSMGDTYGNRAGDTYGSARR